MSHRGRKYGDGDSHPIPVWNGIFDHYARIGMALWTFEWLIDRIPKDAEQDGVGKVLGGKPVKIADIVQSMKGATYKSIRLQLDALEEQGYISRRRTPYGHVIEVRNSRKWGIWTPKETSPKRQSPTQEIAVPGQSEAERLPLQGAEIAPGGQNKEDTALHSSKETQQKTAAACDLLAPWKALGSDLPMGSPKFQKIYEHYYTTRNGNPLSVAMERTIQAANKRDIGVPPPFFDAKRPTERREASELSTSRTTERPELEELPWAKK